MQHQDPGRFYCRVTTEKARRFYTIPIQVSRQLYLNMKRNHSLHSSSSSHQQFLSREEDLGKNEDRKGRADPAVGRERQEASGKEGAVLKLPPGLLELLDEKCVQDVRIKNLRGVHTLPRGIRQNELYELSLPERLFQQEKDKIPSLFYSEALGIYESRVGTARNAKEKKRLRRAQFRRR